MKFARRSNQIGRLVYQPRRREGEWQVLEVARAFRGRTKPQKWGSAGTTQASAAAMTTCPVPADRSIEMARCPTDRDRYALWSRACAHAHCCKRGHAS